MTESVDTVIVGAGIVGLATALRLLERRPDTRVLVVDKEAAVGMHQSGHNSGVMHAGVYYPPGSLKAELCVRGQVEMERFADRHDVPVLRNGKVIVALDDREVAALRLLAKRAATNGVRELRWLDRSELRARHPAVAGEAALLSPTTGSVDFGAVCRAMAREVQRRGGELRLSTVVHGVDDSSKEVVVSTDAGDVTAGTAVACAGLQADRLAPRAAGSPRIVPFRGRWYTLHSHAADMVGGHVYPVPDPRFPFLGVHASRRVDGEVWLGPNAVLALGRECYGGGASRRDLWDLMTFRGTWNLARRNLAVGARELWLDRARSAYLRQVRRYLPELRDSDVTEVRRDGIRAQLVRADGSLVDDFDITTGERALHVRSAPSPAATASLVIGDLLAERVVDRAAL